MVTLNGLPPVVRRDARLLILGSFPGRASLEAGRYYAHPQNQFWRLVGDAIGEELADLGYAARLRALKAAGIGLWDVIGRCRRAGSLDGDIRDAEFNDFAPLLHRCRSLELACFNGKTAARHVAHLAAFGIETVVLPSSSPANTIGFARKARAWRKALGALDRRR